MVKTPQVKPDWNTGIYIGNGVVAADERPIEKKYLWGDINKELSLIAELSNQSSCKLAEFEKREWAKEIDIAYKLNVYSAQLRNVAEKIKEIKKDLPADKNSSNW